jgi:hypothetical protein
MLRAGYKPIPPFYPIPFNAAFHAASSIADPAIDVSRSSSWNI